MRRIRILGKWSNKAQAEAATGLAGAAGCLGEEIEVIESVAEPDAACDDEIILVVASPAACTDPNLEKELIAAQTGGRRVICIWAEGEEVDAEPPSAAKKYAYSIVPWDADKLRAVVADDDVVCFETPAGKPLPKVPTERNLCVDEKVKPA